MVMSMIDTSLRERNHETTRGGPVDVDGGEVHRLRVGS